MSAIPISGGEPPRVLFFEGNADGTVGGSYFSLFYLVDGIDRSRYTPVVGFRRDIPFVQRFRDIGLEVHIVRGHYAVGRSWLDSPLVRAFGPLRLVVRLLVGGLNVARFFVVSGPAWRAFLKDQGIDLVHANNSVTRCHDLMLGARLRGIPVITHERGINDHFPRMARFFARRLDAIICISQAVKANLTGHGISRDRMPVIYNAVDPARVKPGRSADVVRRAYGLRDDQPVLAMVGNVRRWKGQDVVVKALARVVERHPDVVCFFVGEATEGDRPFERELHEFVAGHGLAPNVRFVGYQENVADFVAAADLSIHASVLPEPFGRVLLEAMALRKPVIGSRSGAVPEIVLDGVTGRTFAPGDADDLAACVLQLLSDSSLAVAMGEAGYQRLTTTFSIRENVMHTERLYGEILGRDRPTVPHGGAA